MKRIALAGVLLIACGGGTVSSAPTANSAQTSAAVVPAAASATGTPVAITDSAYGRIAIRTAPGARCGIRVRVGPPMYGDVPPPLLDGTADAGGVLTVSYPAPHLPGGPGRHEVTCGTATATADFTIPSTGIPAARFSVRLRAAAIDEPVVVDTTTVRLDPALVPARDLDVAALQRSLVVEWTAATRGLSAIDLVAPATADLVISVLPARGTSVHLTAGDGSQAVFLYASDQTGVLTSDNLVAVALHELGHIWCCHGADASADGHWAIAVADPLLQGIDRFGIMNHPVQCVVFGSIDSCPNRFSERELRSMGFAQIPPPPRNACVDSKNALLAQLAAVKDRATAGTAAVDQSDASLAGMAAQIKVLEAQYPNGMPPGPYATYTSLIDRYNALAATERSQVASYNALIAQSNGLVDQLNKLIC